jgi:hypothetical protein
MAVFVTKMLCIINFSSFLRHFEGLRTAKNLGLAFFILVFSLAWGKDYFKVHRYVSERLLEGEEL